MNQKTTLLILGLTLAISATLALAPIVNEMAFAISPGGAGGTTGGVGGAISPGGAGGVGGSNGVNGGGTSNACSNAGAAEQNPHCNGGQTPSGQTITGSFNSGD
jgi:hypothetical protein